MRWHLLPQVNENGAKNLTLNPWVQGIRLGADSTGIATGAGKRWLVLYILFHGKDFFTYDGQYIPQQFEETEESMWNFDYRI